jgi:hypothetical protein
LLIVPLIVSYCSSDLHPFFTIINIMKALNS